MKKFLCFFVLIVMLCFAVPMLATAAADGTGSGSVDITDLLVSNAPDLGGEVIIFEESGYDIQVASGAGECGICHIGAKDDVGIYNTFNESPGHPSPAFIASGQGVIQRSVFVGGMGGMTGIRKIE